MTKVLIVGGAGFVGSYIAREYLERGHQVAIMDAFIQYIPSRREDFGFLTKKRLEGIEDKIEMIRGDSRNSVEINDAILNFQPEVIIQLASMPISTLSNVHVQEAMDCCLFSAMNILESIRRTGFVKRFVYTSSSTVYGDFQKDQADEDHPTEPKDVYAGVKLAGENFVKAYCRRFGIDYTIIRPSAVYGPTDVNRRVLQIFVENAMEGKEITLDGGGETKLDFTFVKDLAKGFVLASLSEKGRNETFNLTAGHGRSLREVADILKQHFPDLKVIEKPANPHMPKRGKLGIDKAKELLGFEPDYPLEKGLKEYIDFMKEYRENMKRN